MAYLIKFFFLKNKANLIVHLKRAQAALPDCKFI